MENTQGISAPANEYDPKTSGPMRELLLEALTLLGHYEEMHRLGHMVDGFTVIRARDVLDRADRTVSGFMWRGR
jgi:hypothetical protein